MEATRSADRVGATAAGIAVASLVALVVITGLLSSANPRTDPARFLEDVRQQVPLLQATVWIAAIFAAALVPLFMAIDVRFRAAAPLLTRGALLAGLATALLGAGLVALQAAGAGFVVPTWSEASSATQREALLFDFGALAWSIEAASRLFDLAVTTAYGLASLAMMGTGVTWWRRVGWLGLASAALHYPSVVFVVVAPALEPVHVVADLSFLVWLAVVGWGLARPPVA